jgi:hypothetical protein
MIATMRGFMPALDCRLSMAIKSGIAAKVVPNPATNPRISDRRNLGTSRLDVSCGTNPAQLQSAMRLSRRTQNSTLSVRRTHPPVFNESLESLSWHRIVRSHYPATCLRVISAIRSYFETWRTRAGSMRANKSIVRAITPVQPVWWLAPRPAPLSPWKYS